MSTIPLIPAVIDMFQKCLVDPAGNSLDFKPFHECFEKSETVTAKDVLARDYLLKIKRDIPKIILYIVMDKELGQCDGKAENGCLGYHLKVKSDD